MAVNLLTYNTHGLPWNRVKMPEIANWIFGLSNADVVCLQEVFSKKDREYLVYRTEEEGWVALFPDDLGCIPGLECSSGLMILVRPNLTIVGEPVFQPFKTCNGVDRFVSKGYFKVTLSNNLHEFQLFNTHMQSDVTEFWCRRLNYVWARCEQEKELFLEASKEELPVILGDINTNRFEYFVPVDPDFHITFPGTGEHLDHLLILDKDMHKIDYAPTVYHMNVPWSDHIPVVYQVRFRRRSSRAA
jgi:exonuclease III